MAKRLRPGKSTPAPSKQPKTKGKSTPAPAAAASPGVGHNSAITKAETARAHELLSRLEGALETAKGRVQQTYNDLKEQGHDTKALKEARKRLREDPIEAQMSFENYLLYCAYLGVDESVEQARQQGENAANGDSVEAAERAKAKGGSTISLADVKKLPATHHLRAVYADGLRGGLEGEKCEHGYGDGSDAAFIYEAAHGEGLEQRATAARMDPAHA